MSKNGKMKNCAINRYIVVLVFLICVTIGYICITKYIFVNDTLLSFSNPTNINRILNEDNMNIISLNTTIDIDRINQTNWIRIRENMNWGVYLPDLKDLYSQLLIKKHNILIHDLLKLYNQIPIILAKPKSCGQKNIYCSVPHFGIGARIVTIFRCIFNQFKMGNRPVVMEPEYSSRWTIHDKSRNCSTWFDCYLKRYNYSENPSYNNSCDVSTVWFSNKYGNIVHYSMLVNYFFNGPRIINNTQFKINNNDCMVINIRKSDNCWSKFRRCHNYSEYIEGANIMKEMYDVKNVILITDASDIDIGIKMFEDNGFNIEYNKQLNRTVLNTSKNQETHMGTLGPHPIKGYIDDVYWGSKCKLFIGTFSSSVSKLIFDFMVYKLQYIPPFYSLGGCAAIAATKTVNEYCFANINDTTHNSLDILKIKY